MVLSASWGSGSSISDAMCKSTLSTMNGFTNHFCKRSALRRGVGLKISVFYGFDGFLESCKQIRFLQIESLQHPVKSSLMDANSESSIVADILSQSRIFFPIKCMST